MNISAMYVLFATIKIILADSTDYEDHSQPNNMPYEDSSNANSTTINSVQYATTISKNLTTQPSTTSTMQQTSTSPTESSTDATQNFCNESNNSSEINCKKSSADEESCQHSCVPDMLLWPTVGILAINLVVAAVQLALALCTIRRRVRVRNKRLRRRLERQSIEVHTICDVSTQVRNARMEDCENIWVEYIQSLDKKAATTNSPLESAVVVSEDEIFESFEIMRSEEAFGAGLERIFDQRIIAGEENLGYCTNDEINTSSTV